MMTGFRLSSKWKTGLLLSMVMLFVSACANGKGEDFTSITVQKDGTILSYIVESFEQDYYDSEELQQAILTEAANYNKTAGNGKINVEKIDVDGGVATVRMIYQEAGDYAGFNHIIFFVGNTEKAGENYELNVVLSGTKDANDTVGRADILAMTDYKLLITDVQEPVFLDGKAEYVSDNVTVSNDRKNIQLSGDGLGYVLYK